MRPIVADIAGTEIEKRFFHRFRLAVSGGLGKHIWGFSPFWNSVVPMMSHQDVAIKHAVIALGTAYHMFQLPDKEGQDLNTTTSEGFTRENLEVFTIQQYNQSITELQRHVGSASPESIQVTLVCCLAFICLETLRKNNDAAVTHLINGLNILESLPLEHFKFLAETVTDPDVDVTSHYSTNLANNLVDMRDIIQLFGRLEASGCFFTSGFRPIVAERGYAYRKFDDGSYSYMADRSFEFRSLRESHRAIAYFLRDVLARLYETTHTDEHRDPMVEAQQQECLRVRGERLDTLIKTFMAGCHAPAPDSPEHLCLQLDMLHLRSAQSIIASIDESLGYDYHHYTPSVSPSTSPLPSPSLSIYSSGNTPPSYPLQYHLLPSYLSPPVPHNRSRSSRTAYAIMQTPDNIPSTTHLHADLLSIAAAINSSPARSHLRPPTKDRIFFNDAGILGPVYLVAVTSADATLRQRAVHLLSDMDGGYGGFFWDGPGLRQRLGLVGPGEEGEEGESSVLMGALPLVQEGLERIARLGM